MASSIPPLVSLPVTPVRKSNLLPSSQSTITSQPRARSRAHNYTAAVVRGQHPRSVRSASEVWDYVSESTDRRRHVSTGERLHTVVDRGIKAGRPSTGNSVAATTYQERLPSQNSRSARSAPNSRLLRTFSSPHFHQHMTSKGRKLPAGGPQYSPTRYMKFPPPYKKSFLPARISTPQHVFKRSNYHFYHHKVKKVEDKVRNLAKALGVDVTPSKQQKIDLSPSTFTGFVPTNDPKKWTEERFSTYFNHNDGQNLLYGGDFGLETLGGSWLGVDRHGRVASRPVTSQSTEEKVTFRFLNLDNLLAYQPLVYGKPVWVVIMSGLGTPGPAGWKTGSFLGAKVQKNVALPISEQVVDEDFKKIAEKVKAEGGHIPDANSNVKRNNMMATSVESHHQFFSKEVGAVRPISGAIPTNRSEYQMYIERPTQATQILNRHHAPLGRWLIRSASGKLDGDIVTNLDELYLEQDFYYLSAGHVTRDTDSCLRQLPHDFKTRKFDKGQYRIDRRGVFKIHLSDTNPNNLGLSVSDISVKELESRAKGSLLSSQSLRNGSREYSVIDTQIGIPRPLHGGERFSKEIRLQLMREQQKLDADSLHKAEKRNRNPHKFFGDMFNNCGPPDDDIIARISGASHLGDSESIAGTLAGDSVISKLTYGPVLGGSRPNTVSFSRTESSHKLNTFLDKFNDSESSNYDDIDEYSMLFSDNNSLVSNHLNPLCDSVSVGPTFKTLREEDKEIYDKLARNYEQERYEAMMKSRREGKVFPPPLAHSPETHQPFEEQDRGDSFGFIDLESRAVAPVGKGRRKSVIKQPPEGVRRTLMLSHPRKVSKEERLLDDMVPNLLNGYAKDSMIKSMKNLDNNISNMLVAKMKEDKFNQLANFEAMAKENLKIEQKIRSEKEAAEMKEKEEKEKRRVEAAARRKQRQSMRADDGGSCTPRRSARKSNPRHHAGTCSTRNSGEGENSRNDRGTQRESIRNLGGSQIDGVEAELIKKGIRKNRGTQQEYKKKLLKANTSMRLTAKSALQEAQAETV